MRKSAYGFIKEAQVVACLPAEEQEELERLDGIDQFTAGLYPEEALRLETLWAKAFALHEELRELDQQ